MAEKSVHTGTSDDDTITGGIGNDTIDGGEGHDGLDGEAGNDELYGGTGNDTLYGGEDHDRIEGGAVNRLFLPGLVLGTALAVALAGCGSSGTSPSSMMSPAESMSDEDYLSFGQGTDVVSQTGVEPPGCPPGTRRAGYAGIYYCRPLPSSGTTADTDDEYADNDTPQEECLEAVDLLGQEQCAGSTEVTFDVDTDREGKGDWPIDISDFVDTAVRPHASPPWGSLLPSDDNTHDPNDFLEDGGGNANEAFTYRMVGIVAGTPPISLMQTRKQGDEDLSSGFGFGGWLHSGAHFAVQYVVPGDYVVASHGGTHRGHPRTLERYTGVWEGSMIGIDKDNVDIGSGEYGTLYGNARIEGKFPGGGMTTMNVDFTEIYDIKNDEAYEDISFPDVPVSNGRFAHVKDTDSEISGEFMNAEQDEVVGTFQDDKIAGAFGAYREQKK